MHVQLRPGLHLYRKFLSFPKQTVLGEWCHQQNLKGATPTVSRLMVNLDRSDLSGLATQLIDQSHQCDQSIKEIYPNKAFLVKYLNTFNDTLDPNGLPWHLDDPVYGGILEAPIISLSLGNSCDFAYVDPEDLEAYQARFSKLRLNIDDIRPSDELNKVLESKVKIVTLDSGDVLVFGGSCRKMYHSVRNLQNNDPLGYGDRINLTLRHLPVI